MKSKRKIKRRLVNYKAELKTIEKDLDEGTGNEKMLTERFNYRTLQIEELEWVLNI